MPANEKVGKGKKTAKKRGGDTSSKKSKRLATLPTQQARAKDSTDSPGMKTRASSSTSNSPTTSSQTNQGGEDNSSTPLSNEKRKKSRTPTPSSSTKKARKPSASSLEEEAEEELPPDTHVPLFNQKPEDLMLDYDRTRFPVEPLSPTFKKSTPKIKIKPELPNEMLPEWMPILITNEDQIFPEFTQRVFDRDGTYTEFLREELRNPDNEEPDIHHTNRAEAKKFINL
jgi:hypothetical protein